jgi:uncharacterized metal-binding protein YceD (DUF177 family)
MKISFDKVNQTPKVFEFILDNVVFSGKLYRKMHHEVFLEGAYEGSVEVSCDRCGKSYQERLSTPLLLRLSDSMIVAKDDLDIIEFLDGMIDLEYILTSEINAQKESYNYCESCNSEDDFEMEF